MSRYFFLLFCLVLTITVITLAAGEVTNKRLADCWRRAAEPASA